MWRRSSNELRKNISSSKVRTIVADDDGQGKFYLLIHFVTDDDDSLMQEQAHPLAWTASQGGRF